MSLLETYINEIVIDTTINEFNLREMQLKLPALKHKWVSRFIRHKQELQKLVKQKERSSKNLVEETIKKAPVSINTSTASISRMVENSTSIQEMNDKIEELKLILELLEKTEKIMGSCTFDFKNIIEIIKAETQ